MTGEGNYKGLDLSFEKRLRQGYSYRASYTVSESRDQAPEHLNAASGRPQNGRDLASWEGPSDFDICHRLVANFIVELPFGPGRARLQDGPASRILGGWLVSGIFSARSGRPITVSQGNNNVGPGAEGLPNLVGDPKGPQIVSAGFEGPGHQMRSFAGTRDDRHPLLWVATTNNMIEDRGETTVRFRPAPTRADLAGVSREVVMDREPWTYAVSAKEIAREGRIRPDAPSGTGAIPDPRQFVYIEACGEVTNATLAVAVGITDGGGGTQWFTSDGGLPEFRIARSGCFRAAIALPASTRRDRLVALRVTAFPRPLKKDEPSPERFQVRLTQVNQVFTLNERHVPGRTLLSWIGDVTLTRERPTSVFPFDTRRED